MDPEQSRSVERSFKRSIQVESIGHDRFVGHDLQTFLYQGYKITFGGALVAHALSAAVKTMQDPKFLVQSLHCYYISAPKNNLDVVYHVTRLKDGRTISTRGVTATQGKKTVFSCLVSLSVEEKSDLGLTHTDCPMPEVQSIAPSDLTKSADVDLINNIIVSLKGYPVRFIRALNKLDALNVAKVYMWIKAKDTLPYDSQNTHRIAMAFASDINMPSSILVKYPEKAKVLMTTSLDHSIWFHENVDFNQWHLFAYECVRSAHGRPLNILCIYNEAGALVATAMQQSLVRAKL